MDRILSARIDESMAERLNGLARQLHLSKKSVLERAIDLFSKKVDAEGQTDVLDQTFGVWHRLESTEKSVQQSHLAFRKAIERRRR
jgi:hypothetical protein